MFRLQRNLHPAKIKYHFKPANLWAQDWHVMDSTARWRGTIGAAAWASAFKPGPVPLCQIPGLQCACKIEPDTMHVFHLGFGQDLAAGTIVMLAKFNLFKDAGSFDSKLAEGYFFFPLQPLTITNQVVVQLGYHNQILCGRWKATSVMKNRFWHQLQLVCIGDGVLHRHCVDFCPRCIDDYGQEIVEEHG